MKRKIYNILDVSEDPGSLSWWFDVVLVSLILLNVAAIILESVESINLKYQTLFYRFEIISVIFFTVEYVLRIWTANENPHYRKLISGNIRFAFTPMAIIDLLAVLPFYLPFLGIDLRFMRILRVMRLFRLLKITRYVKALSLMKRVFYDKKEELLVAVVFTIFLLLITSILMYYVENGAQPEAFASIPETMWWGIATLTTVGYGDMYPITGLGKLLGGAIALLGIGLFALPAGILASGFSDALQQKKQGHNGKGKNEAP